MVTANSAIDANYRAEVIEGLLRLLHEHYVYPDVAAAIEDSIRRRLSNHEYDTVTTGTELCAMLTTHLQEISHDKHLHVRYSNEPQPQRNNDPPTPDERAEWQQDGMLHNFGFEKVERLPGNIGYLDLRTFFNPEFAGETAVG